MKKTMTRPWLLTFFLLLSLGKPVLNAQEAKKEKSPPSPGLYARFTTTKGEMLFLLDYEHLPVTVSNFTLLAQEDWFKNRDFFNFIKNYTLILGAPMEEGQEQTFPREQGGLFSCGDPGALTMASTAGEDQPRQMLILIKGDAFLDRKYSAFGRMVSGLETLKRLNRMDRILNVEILRMGTKAEAFQPNIPSLAALIQEAKKKKREEFAQKRPLVAAAIKELGEDVQESATGIFYRIEGEGEGDRPRPGNRVRMHYSGRLVTGEEFDSSFRRNEPFQFTLGVDGVIPGWVETALSMKPGERRTVIIPPELAYGKTGYGPIPPDSWLIFNIELLDFQ